MKALLSSLFLGLSMTVHANDVISMDVNMNQSNFVVTLPANPTTGYQWSVVQFDKNLLALNSSKYEGLKTAMVGAGGEMHFTFALQKGKTYPDFTEIQFKYARSWEPKSGIVKNVKVNFVKEE